MHNNSFNTAPLRSARTGRLRRPAGYLKRYLNAIDDVSATVDSNKDFIAVIEDVLERAVPSLDELVERSTPECKVADLEDVSEGAWPALAEHGRFPATFNNVSFARRRRFCAAAAREGQ